MAKAFIAMEYLEGRTLKHIIAGRPMALACLLDRSQARDGTFYSPTQTFMDRRRRYAKLLNIEEL